MEGNDDGSNGFTILKSLRLYQSKCGRVNENDTEKG